MLNPILMISKVKVLHLKKAKGEQPFCRVVNLLLRLRDVCPQTLTEQGIHQGRIESK